MSDYLVLHPDAEQAINEKGMRILSELKFLKEQQVHDDFKPDILTSKTITEKDIKSDIANIVTNIIDKTGKEVGRFFIQDSQKIGLLEDDYQKFNRMCSDIFKNKSFNDCVSFITVLDVSFRWLMDKYRHQTFMPLTLYLQRNCIPKIKEYEVWIPIAHLYIQSEIEIGFVTLKTLSKDIFDNWCSIVQTNCGDGADSTRFISYIRKEQIKLQGQAASNIKITAEERRAREIALDETLKAISLLNFFSLASSHPSITSHCTVSGMENIPSTKHILISNGISFHEEQLIEGSPVWKITDEWLSYIGSGLKILSDLLKRNPRNRFEDKLLQSLFLFARSAMLREISEKLIYIFTSIESLLLKNDNEPIQKNIAERLAFVVGRDLEERKDIIRTVVSVYGLRSRFFHHGLDIDELKTVEKFMLHIWKFYFLMIENSHRHSTKEELINAIEERKLM